MFRKMLIVNRGEIAVRIVRACRELGITPVALYEQADQGSLHVRLADEAYLLTGPRGFFDQEAVLEIARACGADAVHPGYGFLAENPAFVRACEAAGLTFVGPSADLIERLINKLETLQAAEAAGIPTVRHSAASFEGQDSDGLLAAAEALGYPVVVKSCSGGRGRGERLVTQPAGMEAAVRRTRAETTATYGSGRLYLEHAISGAHQIGVQIIADRYGQIVQLGEREGSLISGNQKVIEEAPAPCLSEEARAAICAAAVTLARAVGYQGVGTVEFITDKADNFYFTEFKARLQVEHVLPEMLAGIDLVQEQIRLATGEPLSFRQEDVQLRGAAIMVRIHAEDPWDRFMPSPGRLDRVRFPGGPGVRVDTYIYGGCDVPPQYDSLIAKLTVKAADRPRCVDRMRCALEDSKLIGSPTNLPMLQRVVRSPGFVAGEYDTSYLLHPYADAPAPAHVHRHLAAMAAVLYTMRNQAFDPVAADRFQSNWHRSGRRLPS